MQTTRPDVRIELIRQSEIVSTATPNFELVKLSSNNSIFDFPMMHIESDDPELNRLLMGFAKDERLRLWWDRSADKDGSFTLGCEVGFYKKDTKFDQKDGENKLSINVKGIHSAFRLALNEISNQKEFKNCNFEIFVKELFDMAKVPCGLFIDESLKKKEFCGFTNRTNLYRLFKEVCMLVGASVSFKPDNSVHIEPANQRLGRLAKAVPVSIGEEDIISMSHSESF